MHISLNYSANLKLPLVLEIFTQVPVQRKQDLRVCSGSGRMLTYDAGPKTTHIRRGPPLLGCAQALHRRSREDSATLKEAERGLTPSAKYS